MEPCKLEIVNSSLIYDCVQYVTPFVFNISGRFFLIVQKDNCSNDPKVQGIVRIQIDCKIVLLAIKKFYGPKSLQRVYRFLVKASQQKLRGDDVMKTIVRSINKIQSKKLQWYLLELDDLKPDNPNILQNNSTLVSCVKCPEDVSSIKLRKILDFRPVCQLNSPIMISGIPFFRCRGHYRFHSDHKPKNGDRVRIKKYEYILELLIENVHDCDGEYHAQLFAFHVSYNPVVRSRFHLLNR